MGINQINAFKGQHCETTATGTLLNHIGIELSEPMLFGIGEGLSFIFWKMKTMDFPFLGGRVKVDLLTENICRNLNLHLNKRESSSVKKAWQLVSEQLDKGGVVGLKLDCFHLDYFKNKFHFAGHYAAIYGYDDQDAFLVDTLQQGSIVTTSLQQLALARNEKGPMSSKNLMYTIEQTDKGFDLNTVMRHAIKNNAKTYLNPPIKNIAYKGIQKASKEIAIWFEESNNIESEFAACASIMEKAGTGGALFRNLYRDFLKEAAIALRSEEIHNAYQAFSLIAVKWTELAALMLQICRSNEVKYVSEASAILLDLSHREKLAMESLQEADF